jgi:catechol 2,3-dioxygenase-like lactoylglutathione lyase family enzyme
MPTAGDFRVSIDLHHVHLFAADLDTTLAWWRKHFDAQILYDGEMAGARNVFVAVGSGRMHFYDQPPRENAKGAVHHLGIRISDLRTEWDRMAKAGLRSPNGLREFSDWRYVMVSAPDNVLLELFEFDDPEAICNQALPERTR